MNLEQVKEYYNKHITEESTRLSVKKKQIFRVGTLRLLVVLGTIAGCYFLWGNGIGVGASFVVGLAIFLALLKYHSRLFYAKRYSEEQINFAQNELKAIDYDFSAFDGAKEKADPNHSFSYDLDIFGERSIFQSINRSVTMYGKDKIADTILHPFEKKENILCYQAAIKELSEKPELLRHYTTVGKIEEMDNTDIKQLSSQFVDNVLSKPFYKSGWKYMLYVMPILTIATILIYVFDMVSDLTFILMWGGLMAISSIPLKKLKLNIGMWEKSSKVLLSYSKLLEIVESQQESESINNILAYKNKGKDVASVSIRKLSRIVENFNQTFTIPGIFFLNPTMIWCVRYAIQLEKWIETYKDDIDTWIDDLAKFESLVSLANYAYNHPDYTYPEVADKFTFEAKKLGHPLLHRDKCVRNDVIINKHPYFLIVTGANMAGKSTYLRTVGLNLTLASIGVPVFAKSLSFYPFKLVTNLRTSDSLSDNESYFFAELKRLKMIIDRLEKGEQLFIILDEILKGTNSEDKQKGSIALMKQLIRNNGCGIIATHDLILGELEKEFPNSAKNYRFEADIQNEELSFSYQIREGVAQNMNACFLMKKMGITGI